MNANDVIRQVLSRENLSTTRVSQDMGKSRSYINVTLLKNGSTQVSTLASFCEATNYELVVRSRDDGYEFIIDE